MEIAYLFLQIAYKKYLTFLFFNLVWQFLRLSLKKALLVIMESNGRVKVDSKNIPCLKKVYK
jgi:hypothetical protein